MDTALLMERNENARKGLSPDWRQADTIFSSRNKAIVWLERYFKSHQVLKIELMYCDREDGWDWKDILWEDRAKWMKHLSGRDCVYFNITEKTIEGVNKVFEHRFNLMYINPNC